MPRLTDLMQSATRRKAREQHRLAMIVAYAVNDPKHLDKVAPGPDRPQRAIASDATSSTLGKGQFEEKQWW